MSCDEQELIIGLVRATVGCSQALWQLYGVTYPSLDTLKIDSKPLGFVWMRTALHLHL
jgi:hypothetical protein